MGTKTIPEEVPTAIILFHTAAHLQNETSLSKLLLIRGEPLIPVLLPLLQVRAS